jgi:glyoxylase-like metal-dependent hydrolase (beta-lactamase superfamily II)
MDDFPMKISDNIFLIRNRHACANSVVLKGEKCILFDPGTTSWGNVRDSLTQLKTFGIDRIDEIWLTHAHPDHSQAVRYFKKRFGAKLRCDSIAKEILESQHPLNAFLAQQREGILPLLSSLFSDDSPKAKAMTSTLLAFTRWGVNCMTRDWRTTEVDEILRENEIVDGMRVIRFPGHTPEEIGFFMEKDRVLITGDLIAIGRGAPLPVLNILASDIDAALKSLKVMRELEPKMIIPAHWDVIEDPKRAI